MAQWVKLKLISEITAGTRLKIKGKIYDVVSIGDQAITLNKLGSEKLTLQYKSTFLIYQVEIWIR